ncbi:MAG: hypothetical protein P8L85_01815, partial [Rubripirellula sp.]|nr:hypothetical protein [Rubripirellula sp.]
GPSDVPPTPLAILNIVIVHCHFERGGVTQVVENHVRWLAEQPDVERIFLLSGDRVGGLSDQTLRLTESIILPGFDYDSVALQTSTHDFETRAGELFREWNEQARALQISPEQTVIHWHNHSLGKNAAVPMVIQRLATAGWRLLLQIHDFAEDNRPENYAHLAVNTNARTRADLDAFIYPVANQIHYATLTRFDAEILSQIGIPGSQSHCLPNSVTAASSQHPDRSSALQRVRQAMDLPCDANWCLYPVRGIRRKNVGEFLFVSRMTPPNCYAGLTLCPTNPLEKKSYERWRQAAERFAPRSVFDAAHHPDISFGDNLAASQFILSTSVAEGFGMAFLEPWLSQREVIARRLESVTADFEQSNVRLPKLYDALPIPGDKDWIQECRRESSEIFAKAWRSVPESFRPSDATRLPDAASPPAENVIDFAHLTPRRQLEVLQRVTTDSGFDAAVREYSAELIGWMHQDADPDLLQQNAESIDQSYSLGSQGRQLQQIYRRLLSCETDPHCNAPLNAGSALETIHAARPLFPCRMETLDD